ncbi:MAG: STAS domain-containing protein [Victivallales bacterium]|nr:STAS domain-containing protein [Victivallales bacterium]
MEITEIKDNGKLTLELDGRFDALAALELEKMLKKSLEGVKELIFDFARVKVIASAGLRVLVQTKKQMNSQGTMKIVNINDSVREILTITKLIKLLDVE